MVRLRSGRSYTYAPRKRRIVRQGGRALARAAGGAGGAARAVGFSRAARFGGVGLGALAAYGTIKGINRIRRARKRQAQRNRMVGVGVYKPPNIRKNVVISQTGGIAQSSHTMLLFNLCKIPFDNTAARQDTRSTKAAYIYGFKHEENFVNNLTTPVTIHQFWLVPTVNKDDNADLSAGEMGSEWFNEDGGSVIDTINFPSTETYMGYNRKINTAKFKILKRLKTHLGGKRDQVTNANGNPNINNPSFLLQNMMIPCKKTFVYEDSAVTTQTESPPVYYVRYISVMLQGSSPPTAAVVNAEWKLTTYFKDVQ